MPTTKTVNLADTMQQEKTYHKKASGLAATTVRIHSKENDLKLFGGCFW
jgi:glutathione S-transferase